MTSESIKSQVKTKNKNVHGDCHKCGSWLCCLQHRTRVIQTHLLPFMCVPFINTISSWAERLQFPPHLAARSHLRNRFNQPIKKEKMKEVWWWWWWWEERITIHVEHEMEIESVHAAWLASFFIYLFFAIQETEQPVQDVSRLARCRDSSNHGSRYMTCESESPRSQASYECEWWSGSWSLAGWCACVRLCYRSFLLLF